MANIFMGGSGGNIFLGGAKKKSKWIDDPNSLLKENDFTTAQKSMRTEVMNKTNTLRDKGLAIPGEGDDRNRLEKLLNTPQNKGLLGDLLDVISRGQYASANIAKTLTDDKKDSIGSVLGSGYRGLSGQDRTSYRDVLEQSGMKQGKLRSALGFAGDVLLDPTTYLTLGTGTAAKVGGKTTAKGLGKLPQLLGKEAVDKGGLKFMGASLIPGKTIEKGAEKAGLLKAGNAIRDTKPVQALGKAFVPNFREAGTDKNVWNSFVDTKKGYQNTLSYAQNKAVEDAIKMAKGFTKEERTLATHAIQNPQVYRFADEKVQKLADLARKTFDDSSKVEKELGLLKNLHPNYVPGIYPEKSKGLLQGIIKKDGIKASIGSHGKQKKFETLKDAMDAGLKPETDIAKLVGQRQVVSARATETQKFINETLEKYGTKINAKNIDNLDPSMGVYLPKGSLAFFPSGTVPDEVLELVKGMSKDEMIEIPAGALRKGMIVSKNVPVYALPKQIAGELNNFRKAQTNESSKGVLGAYDAVLNLWKGYATAVNPGFHMRNAQSNVFQTGLNSAKPLLNPANHAKALGLLLSDKKKLQPWLDKNSIDVGGRNIPLSEVKEMMKKDGVINNGWLAKDMPNFIGDKLDLGLRDKLSLKTPKQASQTAKTLGQLANPLSQKNALIRGGRAVGNAVENQARAFTYLSELKKTGDPKQAAKAVDKHLFDYGDVTDFERSVMKRTIPFYTWMRKNIPLQVENVIKTPGKYAATNKALDSIRDLSDPVGEENLPEYMDNPNWVRTPLRQSDNPVYWNSNLPMGDLEKINPANLGGTALGSLSPLLKTPLELKLNQNTFFNSEIEKYPGEMKRAPAYLPKLSPEIVEALGGQYGLNKEGEKELQVPAKARYMMQQIPFLENVSKSMDLKDEKKFNQILSFLAGAKITPYDPKKGEMNALYNQREALRDIFDKYQTKGLLESDTDLAEEKKSKTIKKSSNPFK